MVRSSKIVVSAEIIFMLLIINFKKKHDVRIFRDCIKSDSEKGDIEKKSRELLFC